MHMYWYIPSHSHNISMKYYYTTQVYIYSRLHIYLRIHIPPKSNWQYIYEILLHQTGVWTYSPMHIYWGYIYAPKLQFTTHLWNNVTPNELHISQNAHILRIHIYPPNSKHNYGIMLHQINTHISRMHIYEDTYPHLHQIPLQSL